MSWLDGLAVIITALLLLRGFQLGLIRSLFRYLSILAGLVAVIYCKELASAQLMLLFPNIPALVSVGISIAALFIVGLGLTQMIGFFLSKLLSPTPLGPLDRVFGAVFGSIKSVLILTLAFYLFSLLPPLILNKLHISQSLLFTESQKFIPLIESKVRSIQSRSKSGNPSLDLKSPKNWVKKINSAAATPPTAYP